MVLLLPAAVYLLAWAFASSQNDPTGGAETRYLAVLITAALTLQAAISPHRHRGLLWTAGLALVALLVVPAGSTRGSLCMTIIAIGLVAACLAAWRARRGHLSVGWAVALCMAAQLFARPRLLLDLSTDPVLLAGTLLALPGVTGICLAVIATRTGTPAALITGGTLAALVPGWDASTTALCLALAGAAALSGGQSSGKRSSEKRATNVQGDSIAHQAGRRGRRWMVRLGVGILLLAPTAWHGWNGEWATGLAATASAVAVMLGLRHKASLNAVSMTSLSVISLGLAALASAFWWPAASGGQVQVIDTAVLALTLIPTLPLLLFLRASSMRPLRPLHGHAGANDRSEGDGSQRLDASTGLVAIAEWFLVASLLVLASRMGASSPLLGAAIALLVLPSTGGGTRRNTLQPESSQPHRCYLAVQGWWTAALVALTSLLTAYPWARQDAFGDARSLLGVEEPAAVAVLVVSLTALGWVAARWGAILWSRSTTTWPRRWLLRGALATIALALIFFLTPPPGIVFAPATTLHTDFKTWQVALPAPMAARRVVVDSIAANSLDLLPGSVIGTVQLLDADQEMVAEWPMISGQHTAEWAMERPDVAALLAGSAPAPYAAGMVVNGTFFARWFRARFVRETPVNQATYVAIRLADNVPDGLQVVLQRVEVAR